MRRHAENPWMDRLARGVLFPCFSIAHRLRWHGVENVPRAGPAIIAANHQSFYDPVLIGIAVYRRIRWLGWDFYCDMPILGPLMRLAGTVPVDPDDPTPRSLALMVRVLQAGGLCGIFPEGGRTSDGLIAGPKHGVGALALRTGTPIVPVTIHGAYRAWPKGRALPRPAAISLRFGRPIFPPSRAARAGREGRRVRAGLTFRTMLSIADGFAELGAPALARACRERLSRLWPEASP